MSSSRLPPSVEPAEFLVENVSLLPKGRILDLAMGKGRNAVYLALLGYAVEGVDISDEAIGEAQALAEEVGVAISTRTADLEAEFEIPAESYDGIVVFNYLQRSLTPQIVRGLRPGGVLIYETFTVEQPQFGRPTNPDFLLRPNELLEMFRDLLCLRYREGILPGPRAIASIVAQRV